MDPYCGEIKIFGFNYAPANWAFCNGQLIPVHQQPLLYSVIHNNFGGGKEDFNLPNLVGQAAGNMGTESALTPYTIGAHVGTKNVTLEAEQLPAHRHTVTCYAPSNTNMLSNIPSGASFLARTNDQNNFKKADAPMPFPEPNTTFGNNMIAASGGGQPHENRQPFLVMNFCICLFGIFPVRS